MFKAISWNIEGLSRHLHSLKCFMTDFHSDFVFISEPQVFQNDIDLLMQPLRGDYSYSLNSADLYDQDLPLVKARAHGGTMILWRTCHDPYISLHPVSTPAILPLIFSPPSNPVSIHVCVYLPTHGQDTQFVAELSTLSACLLQLLEKYPAAPIYLRGDFNVSDKNKRRTQLFQYFCSSFDLTETHIGHKTYHHFVGNGASDSNLDKLVFSNNVQHPESVLAICCKLSNPLVFSSHDPIVSKFVLPRVAAEPPCDDNIVAPKIRNSRRKVVWDEAGIEKYQEIVVPELHRIQQQLLPHSVSSKSSAALLFESTNNILVKGAELTNKTFSLCTKPKSCSKSIPIRIRQSANYLLKEHKKLDKAVKNESENVKELRTNYISLRSKHQKLLREYKAEMARARDTSLYSVCTQNRNEILKNIRRVRRQKAYKISKLNVGTKTYVDGAVPDGFYDSISRLKSRDDVMIENSESYEGFKQDYDNIIKICKSGSKIPQLSEQESFSLLHSLKPEVSDIFGITPNHYSYAGPQGWRHFYLLLTNLIENINNCDITEINAAYACILFKGHRKDKCSDTSYRTISTCPVVAKALDTYVRNLCIGMWNMSKPVCQFQGEDSSHELAALLVTECIQYSIQHLKKPLFILYLDAKSAFDVVLKELLVKNLYHTGTRGELLLYLDKRLGNRQTFLDWNGTLMGPIRDQQGLEQGGVSSSDLYKIFGSEQLTSAHASELGVHMGPLAISCVGQADDTALLSNNINQLYYLLQLSLNFCSKYHVQLSPGKTKLQVYQPKGSAHETEYLKKVNPITINNEQISFENDAEHVGLVRSTTGNLPAILARLEAYKCSLQSVLHTGMARAHRGNPAASLFIHQMYASPVLFSGLGSLVLSDHEKNMINQHHKDTLSNLQRLIPLTPRPVVHFLAGVLPGTALLHLRQLSIFGMITRLPDNILHKHFVNILEYQTVSPGSWLHQIGSLCQLYSLPHPASLLAAPLSKHSYKHLTKKKVIGYWEIQLRAEAFTLTSLKFFNPNYMSLSSPHPVWTSAGSSPTKVAMACVQAKLLSGRYRTQALCSHWQNGDRKCKLSEACSSEEDTTHMLQNCSGLETTGKKVTSFTSKYCNTHPIIANIVSKHCHPSSELFCQFLLDCSILPEVICLFQEHGKIIHEHLFNITRVWCYSIHRDRLKILGRWREFHKA